MYHLTRLAVAVLLSMIGLALLAAGRVLGRDMTQW